MESSSHENPLKSSQIFKFFKKELKRLEFTFVIIAGKVLKTSNE